MWIAFWNTQATPYCEFPFITRYSWPFRAKVAFLLFKEGKNGFIHWLTWYDFNEWFPSASYCLKSKQCYLSAFLETDGQNCQTWVDGFTLIYSDSTNIGDDFQIAWTAVINHTNCHNLTNMWKETYTWEIYWPMNGMAISEKTFSCLIPV